MKLIKVLIFVLMIHQVLGMQPLTQRLKKLTNIFSKNTNNMINNETDNDLEEPFMNTYYLPMVMGYKTNDIGEDETISACTPGQIVQKKEERCECGENICELNQMCINNEQSLCTTIPPCTPGPVVQKEDKCICGIHKIPKICNTASEYCIVVKGLAKCELRKDENNKLHEFEDLINLNEVDDQSKPKYTVEAALEELAERYKIFPWDKSTSFTEMKPEADLNKSAPIFSHDSDNKIMHESHPIYDNKGILIMHESHTKFFDDTGEIIMQTKYFTDDARKIGDAIIKNAKSINFTDYTQLIFEGKDQKDDDVTILVFNSGLYEYFSKINPKPSQYRNRTSVSHYATDALEKYALDKSECYEITRIEVKGLEEDIKNEITRIEVKIVEGQRDFGRDFDRRHFDRRDFYRDYDRDVDHHPDFDYLGGRYNNYDDLNDFAERLHYHDHNYHNHNYNDYNDRHNYHNHNYYDYNDRHNYHDDLRNIQGDYSRIPMAGLEEDIKNEITRIKNIYPYLIQLSTKEYIRIHFKRIDCKTESK